MATVDEVMKEEEYRRFRRVLKAWIGYLGLFSLSMIGGIILTWWEMKYHPTNEQQWMVPLGLILFFTPLIVWLAVFMSDTCCRNSSDQPPEKISHDLERQLRSSDQVHDSRKI